MFSYEGGLGVAFLLWLWSTGSVIATLNSQYQRNLNRIGQRISWITFNPTPITKDDLERSTIKKILIFTLFFIVLVLPFILLSWIYVLFWVAMQIYQKGKMIGMPRDIKEYVWKMKNLDLSMDDIIREGMKVKGIGSSDFDKIKAEVLEEIRLSRI